MQTRRPTSEGAEELIGKYFPVLDHGFVSLVDYMGTDESIDETARTTHKSEARDNDARRKLIRRLYRDRHTSPFEFGELVFHMRLPIFVARQWVRHRTASISEQSGRYTLIPDRHYTPSEWRLQSETNKQGSSDEVLPHGPDEERTFEYENLCNEAFSVRTWLDGSHVARELSRLPLPISTYTEWRWKIDLHNLMHCLTLRCASDAQWEAQQYANTIAGIVKRAFPTIYEAWIDYDVCGVRFSRQEILILRDKLDLDSLPGGGGLSDREASEFRKKLEYPEVPDHTLDISKAKTVEFFAGEFER